MANTPHLTTFNHSFQFLKLTRAFYNKISAKNVPFSTIRLRRILIISYKYFTLQICPKQGMDFLKSRLPRATDVLIKNCGHVMLLSHIKEVGEHLKRWVDSNERDDEKIVPHKSSNIVLKSPY